MTPIDLRTEHRRDPLAIATATPRLSWRLDGHATHHAWQLQLASDPDFAELCYDSGEVAGDAVATTYAGPALAPRQRCWWRVRVATHDGFGAWSAAAQFARGLDTWQARWIQRHPSWDRLAVAPLLRREFAAPAALREARLYVTARGLAHVTCNGEPISDEALAPGWSDYHQRIYYRCHDVTELITPGADSCLGAILGDGWSRGHLGWDGHSIHYTMDRQLLLQLVMVDADGAEHLVVSDESWQAASSHVLANDLYHGEDVDRQAHIAGWDRPGRPGGDWQAVTVRDLDDTALQPHPAPPVRPIAELPARELWSPAPGRWIADLGQNIAGRVRVTLRDVPAGTRIRLRHGELVNPDGSIYTENLRTARCEDAYIAGDETVETFEPLFTFHGFRYVEFTGLAAAPRAADIVGVVLATDQERIGEVACDHELIERLVANVRWTWKGNTIEVPTDCPQRDERLGWTGDIAAFVPTAARLDDCTAFLDKWLIDLADTQDEEGNLGNVAPHPRWMIYDWPFGKADAGWGDAATVVPWELYRASGDRAILARHLPMMQRWLAHLEATSEGLVRHHDGKSFVPGDWLNANAPCSKDLLMTAWFARSADRTRLAAAALGDEAEAERCGALFDGIAAAFRETFVRDDGLVIGPGQEACSQTAQCSALHFGLVTDALAERVFQRLVEDIEARCRRLSVGFLGVSYLLQVLTDRGRNDLAETILCNEDYPGWLFSVVNGATTVWERWDGWTPEHGPHEPGMNSYSHYAYGAVYDWLMTRLAGLDVLEPGGARLLVAPHPGTRLQRAEASWTTPRGTARCAWRVEGDRLSMAITVPGSSVAEVHVPTADAASVQVAGAECGKTRFDLGPGEWQISAAAPRDPVPA